MRVHVRVGERQRLRGWGRSSSSVGETRDAQVHVTCWVAACAALIVAAAPGVGGVSAATRASGWASGCSITRISSVGHSCELGGFGAAGGGARHRVGAMRGSGDVEAALGLREGVLGCQCTPAHGCMQHGSMRWWCVSGHSCCSVRARRAVRAQIYSRGEYVRPSVTDRGTSSVECLENTRFGLVRLSLLPSTLHQFGPRLGQSHLSCPLNSLPTLPRTP